MSLTGFWNKLFKREARPEARMEDAEDVFWSEMFEPRRIMGPLCWEPRANWRTFWRDAGIDEPLDLSHVNREMSWGDEGRIFSDSVNAENLTSAGTIDASNVSSGVLSRELVLAVMAKEWRVEDIRSEINRLRRNKKKVSHLVAELAELEGRK